MTTAVSTSLLISLAGAALLALMHVSVATVLILGLRRTVPAHRSAETGRSHS